jgi:hypothetical protein
VIAITIAITAAAAAIAAAAIAANTSAWCCTVAVKASVYYCYVSAALCPLTRLPIVHNDMCDGMWYTQTVCNAQRVRCPMLVLRCAHAIHTQRRGIEDYKQTISM